MFWRITLHKTNNTHIVEADSLDDAIAIAKNRDGVTDSGSTGQVIEFAKCMWCRKETRIPKDEVGLNSVSCSSACRRELRSHYN